MLDVPPAYFYTQPGAMGPGMYDNLAPQDWQVRMVSGDALLPLSLAAHGSERGDKWREGEREEKAHLRDLPWRVVRCPASLAPICDPVSCSPAPLQDGSSVTGDCFNPHQQSIDQPGACLSVPARGGAGSSADSMRRHCELPHER
jgi:hypothetical protein